MNIISSDGPKNIKPTLAKKSALLRILEAQDKRTGFTFDPDATPQQARALMLTQEIRPEENTLSCEIKHMQTGE